MKIFLPFFSLILISFNVCSQGFTDVTASNNINVVNSASTQHGSGVSFYDFDKDGLDDLTFVVGNDSIIFYHNNGAGFDRIESIPNTLDAKQPAWVDYDNDGDADLMVSKRSSGTQLYRNNGNMTFTPVTASLGIPFAMGTNIYGYSWADYDKDGWLDVYLGTYNLVEGQYNYLCHNNGNGTFTEMAGLLGIDNGPGLTMQAVWQDFNNDTWPDLYVINEANQPNAMYYNNGDGTFTDVSVSSGAGVTLQSMTNSIADYDNDGDWDIYITNAQAGNYLLRNDDGVFTNVAAASGVTVNSYCWAGMWIDYDHNTWEDLHVCTATTFLNQDWFFLNDEDGTFSDAAFTEFSGDYTYTYSTAKGDYNNDGYWDFAVTKVGSVSTPENYLLFQGNAQSNHWVKLDLRGTYSNRDAIGSLIEYYIDGERRMQYTRCGENYLGQNSQYPILSMGEATQIDSLIITWPRGLVEKWYSLSANQKYLLVEGEQTTVQISVNGPAFICGEGTVTLDAGVWSSYNWGNGNLTRYRTVSEGGTYTVNVVHPSGYPTSGSIVVSAYETPQYTYIIGSPSCVGDADGSIELSLTNGQLESIDWDGPYSGSSISGLPSGTYPFIVYDSNGCSVEGEIAISDPVEISAVITTTPVSCYGLTDGTAQLEISGGTGEVVADWMGEDANALAEGEYTVVVHDENSCSAEFTFEITSPEVLSGTIMTTDVSCYGFNDGHAEVMTSGGTGMITADWSGADPEQLEPGDYTVVLSDVNGCAIGLPFSIGSPDALVISLTSENADNGANGSATADVEGGVQPYSFEWSSGGDEATAQNLAQGEYTCTVTDDNGCEVFGSVLIIDVSVNEYTVNEAVIFPNPAADFFTVFSKVNIDHVDVFSADGRMIFQTGYIGSSIERVDTSLWPQGIYSLHIFTAGGTVLHRVVKE